jgi:hypothetical protein
VDRIALKHRHTYESNSVHYAKDQSDPTNDTKALPWKDAEVKGQNRDLNEAKYYAIDDFAVVDYKKISA